MWKYDPPFPQYTIPTVPSILTPLSQPRPLNPGWNAEKLQEYYDLLLKIKELEDRLGCACDGDRGKPDYLGIIKQQLDALQARVDQHLKE